ncbi:MAG: hypothetical protein C0614_08150 [Desulfuromonas sp.]|nr:MAG: hypothetical protein C0614_08150 [Desulfuromonas sp.]
MRVLVVAFLILLIAAGAVLAEPSATGDDIQLLLIDDFEAGLKPNWKVKSFAGETDYKVVTEQSGKVLRAESRGTASGLVYKIDFNPSDYPLLSWRWKVAGVVAAGDERFKNGDDYAARLYVIFPHWFFPKTRTLNYIWANRLPRDEIIPNAFTSNAMMLAVESGPQRAGQWIEVRRNIIEDYRRAFGEEPPRAGAIAIMTDTDNTGQSAMAWYDDIYLIKRSTSAE